MFLDDELLEITKATNIETEDDIQNLYFTLCRKCEDYYKSQLKPELDKREVKAIFDRTFNLWDSFVNKTLNEKDNTIKILGVLFKEESFKKQVMSNKTISDIYNKL